MARDIEFKFITKDDDSYKALMRPYKWDVVVGNVPYQIVKIPGYVHGLGGSLDYGEGNDFWAYPLGEEPSYENLVAYCGNRGAAWGIEYSPTNYAKTKWDETTIWSGRHLVITRNGKPFYNGFMTFHEALSYVIDGRLDDHPLELNDRDYDKACIGRKVWWRSEPGVITSCYTSNVTIAPDGIDHFTVPKEFESDWPPYYEEGPEVNTSIFDEHIWWFRDNPEESSGGTHIAEKE